MADGFVLTVTQRKGGVGRSTLLFNLAGSFSKRGLRVLMLDLDPQASISQLFLGPEVVDSIPDHRSVCALVDDSLFGSIEGLAVPSGIPGIDLVPGSNALSRFNYPEPEKTEDFQDSLRDALGDVRTRYDAVLCDTPPSLESLSWLPAVAADVVQELTHASRFLDRVRWGKNPHLVWLGVVLTMYQPRLAVHEAFAKSLRSAYGNLILDAVIPYAAPFKECAVVRQPLANWKPKTAAAKAVDGVASEILDRISKLRNSKEVAA
jgi:chromosome partitioning protein